MSDLFLDARAMVRKERRTPEQLPNLRIHIPEELTSYAYLTPRRAFAEDRATLGFSGADISTLHFDTRRDALTVGVRPDQQFGMHVWVKDAGVYVFEINLDLWTGSGRISASPPGLESQPLPVGTRDRPYRCAVAAIMNASEQIGFYFLGLHYFQFSHIRVEKTTGDR